MRAGVESRDVLTNNQNQPLELHLPGGLIVVPARGEVVVSASDRFAPQLQILANARLISFIERPAKPRQPAAETKAEAETATVRDATEETATQNDDSGKPEL